MPANKISRRGFLATAAGIAGMIVSGSRCTNSADPSVHLWDLLVNYNAKRNGWVKGSVPKNDVNEAWKEVIDYNRANRSRIGIDLERAAESDIKEFFLEKNKYYSYLPGLNQRGITVMTLGDIVDVYGHSAEIRNQNIRYKVIEFDQIGDNADTLIEGFSRLAYRDHNDGSVYINMTELNNTCDSIYSFGSTSDINSILREAESIFESGTQKQKENVFKRYMKKELYDSVSSLTRSGFRKELSAMIRKQLLDHEDMHEIYPNSTAEDAFKEVETYLHEIAENPEHNSWVFAVTVGEMPGLYAAYERKGYGLKEIMGMSSKERSDIAENILNN